MKFDDALPLAGAQCEKDGIEDPFYLYCVLSDYVGADFAGKDAAKMLFEIDRRIQVVGNIAKSGKAACILSKAAYPVFKEQYGRKEFCDFLDDVFCILTHAPREARQSMRACGKVAKAGGGKQKGSKKVPAPAPAPAPASTPAVPNIYAGIPPNVPPKYRGLWLLYQTIKKNI